MKNTLKYACPFVLGLGLAACGTSTGNDDVGSTTPNPDTAPAPTPDAAPPAIDTATPAIDTAVPVAEPLVWLSIQDTEQAACATNGPGADIDAVELYDVTGVLGVGLVGSARFKQNPGGWACATDTCGSSGTSNCKYAANSDTYTVADLVARTEGPADATVSATASDTGYFSLNAGTLEIQIGDPTGQPPLKTLKSGDYIKVFEVDQSYVASGAAYSGCTCVPEHYTVTALSQSGNTIVKLKAVQLDANNTTCAALGATSTEGCGSTVFVVP
jgi:hypothetical protein